MEKIEMCFTSVQQMNHRWTDFTPIKHLTFLCYPSIHNGHNEIE